MQSGAEATVVFVTKDRRDDALRAVAPAVAKWPSGKRTARLDEIEPLLPETA